MKIRGKVLGNDLDLWKHACLMSVPSLVVTFTIVTVRQQVVNQQYFNAKASISMKKSRFQCKIIGLRCQKRKILDIFLFFFISMFGLQGSVLLVQASSQECVQTYGEFFRCGHDFSCLFCYFVSQNHLKCHQSTKIYQ